MHIRANPPVDALLAQLPLQPIESGVATIAQLVRGDLANITRAYLTLSALARRLSPFDANGPMVRVLIAALASEIMQSRTRFEATSAVSSQLHDTTLRILDNLVDKRPDTLQQLRLQREREHDKVRAFEQTRERDLFV